MSVGERDAKVRVVRVERGGLANHTAEEVKLYSKCSRKARKVVDVGAMGLKIIPFGEFSLRKGHRIWNQN